MVSDFPIPILQIKEDVLFEDTPVEVKYPPVSREDGIFLFEDIVSKVQILFPNQDIRKVIIIGPRGRYLVKYLNELVEVEKEIATPTDMSSLLLSTEIRKQFRPELHQIQLTNDQKIRFMEVAGMITKDKQWIETMWDEIQDKLDPKNFNDFIYLIQLQVEIMDLDSKDEIIDKLHRESEKKSSHRVDLIIKFPLLIFNDIDNYEYFDLLHHPLLQYWDIIFLNTFTGFFKLLKGQIAYSKILLKPFYEILLNASTFFEIIGNVDLDYPKIWVKIGLELVRKMDNTRIETMLFYNRLHQIEKRYINTSPKYIDKAFVIAMEIIEQNGILEKDLAAVIANYVNYYSDNLRDNIDMSVLERLIDLSIKEIQGGSRDYLYYGFLVSLLYYHPKPKRQFIENLDSTEIAIAYHIYILHTYFFDFFLIDHEIIRTKCQDIRELGQQLEDNHWFFTNPEFQQQYNIISWIERLLDIPTDDPLKGLQQLKSVFHDFNSIDDYIIKGYFIGVLKKIIFTYLISNLEKLSAFKVFSLLQDIEFINYEKVSDKITYMDFMVKLLRAYYGTYHLEHIDEKIGELIGIDLKGFERSDYKKAILDLYNHIKDSKLSAKLKIASQSNTNITFKVLESGKIQR